MSKVYYLKLVVLHLAIVFFLGCASSREKQAFNDLAEVEETHYVMESDDSTTLRLPALNEESTISDYLEYAALNNPGLEAAFNSWKARLEKVPQVRALPDPRFTYAYFVKEVETRAGPQRHKFGLAQMFPWFGKLDLKSDVALEAANAERQKYEAAKLKLFFVSEKTHIMNIITLPVPSVLQKSICSWSAIWRVWQELGTGQEQPPMGL